MLTHLTSKPVLGLFALSIATTSASAQTTLAHWDFDAGRADTAFSDLPAVSLVSPGHIMHGYDQRVGPSYSTDTATGAGLSLRANGVQDGYVTASELSNWAPTKWTIEISTRLNRLEGWTTLIGRDGNSWPGTPKSDFYFQKNGTDNRFRLDFATADGSRYMIETPFAAVRDVWYSFALVCDGATVSLYVDHRLGEGYQLAASTPLNLKVGGNNALAYSGDYWTFGRGWYKGETLDHLDGYLDDIRFTDGALPPSAFLNAVTSAASAAESKLEAARTGTEVSLAWTLPTASMQSYSLYRNDRENPSGRALIATLYPPAKIYLDQVSQAEKTYWYWLVAYDKDGKTHTHGPVASAPGAVWSP